jgi:hypothetical protein
LGVTSLTLLIAQSHTAAFPPILGFQITGSTSAQVRRQTIKAGFTFTGINQVQFTDGQNGHVIVGIGGAAGSVFKTLLHIRDGGKHWEIDGASHTVVGSENAPIHMVFRS